MTNVVYESNSRFVFHPIMSSNGVGSFAAVVIALTELFAVLWYIFECIGLGLSDTMWVSVNEGFVIKNGSQLGFVLHIQKILALIG